MYKQTFELGTVQFEPNYFIKMEIFEKASSQLIQNFQKMSKVKGMLSKIRLIWAITKSERHSMLIMYN